MVPSGSNDTLMFPSPCLPIRIYEWIDFCDFIIPTIRWTRPNEDPLPQKEKHDLVGFRNEITETKQKREDEYKPKNWARN